MARNRIRGSVGREAGAVYCKNLWEVAYLVYQNIRFIKADIQSSRVVFLFPDTVEVRDALRDFVINPEMRIQEYIAVFQRVKNFIYTEKGKY